MDSVRAIYEGGVFKPLLPVSLPEGTEVCIPLPTAAKTECDEEVIAKQQAAWRDFFARMDADPELKREGDGFSGADHDKVLYGATARRHEAINESIL